MFYALASVIILLFYSCKKDSVSISTPTNSTLNNTLDTKSPTLDSGLLCYLPFNGNFKDKSGHHNNGKAFGSIAFTSDKAGNPLKAVSFAASNCWIEIPEAQFDGLETGTIAMDFLSTSTARQLLIGKMSYSIPLNSPGWYQSFILVIQQGFSSPEQFNSKQPGGCDQLNGWNAGMNSNASFSLNQWNHIAVTFSKTKEKMYLNGNLVAAASRVPSPICQGEPIRLGVWWQNDPLFFTGKMDEVRIYNRVLSADEVQQLFSVSK